MKGPRGRARQEAHRPPPLFAPTLLATAASGTPAAQRGVASRSASGSPPFTELPLHAQCRVVLGDWTAAFAALLRRTRGGSGGRFDASGSSRSASAATATATRTARSVHRGRSTHQQQRQERPAALWLHVQRLLVLVVVALRSLWEVLRAVALAMGCWVMARRGLRRRARRRGHTSRGRRGSEGGAGVSVGSGDGRDACRGTQSGLTRSPPSEQKRRFALSIPGSPGVESPPPSSSSSSATSSSYDEEDDEVLALGADDIFFRRNSATFYYDVEEARYQPTARLLFGLSCLFGAGGDRSGGGRGGHTRTTSTDWAMASTSTVGSRATADQAASARAGGERDQRGATPPELCFPIASPLLPQQPHSACFADMSVAQLVEEGYFAGQFGMHLNGGAFQLVAHIGRGTYSTVWLGIDRKGVTQKTSTSLLLRFRHNNNAYNSTAVVSRNVPAYVVLKISRCDKLYVAACEAEYNLNRRLARELQRRQLPLNLMSLYAMSFLENRDAHAGEPGFKPGASQQQQQQQQHQQARLPPATRVNHHFVMVADVCGPSLLAFVTDAPPRMCATARDQLWRLRFIKEMLRQLLTGLDALHACGIVHADVKVENALFALPAHEVLAKMRATVAVADEVVSRHRFAIMHSRSTWRRLASENEPELGHMDDRDVVQLAAQLKLADFGNCVTDRPRRPAPHSPGGTPSSSPPGFALTLLSDDGPNTRSSGSSSNETAGGAAMRYEARPPASRLVMQTREYRCPEVLLQLADSASVTGAMDVWSVACVAFELIAGDYLFNPRRFLAQRAFAAAHAQAQEEQAARCGDQQLDDAALEAVAREAAAAVDSESSAADELHLQMMEELLQRRIPRNMRRPAEEATRLCGEDIKVVSSSSALDDDAITQQQPAPGDSRGASATLLPVLLYEAVVRQYLPAAKGSEALTSGHTAHLHGVARLREEVVSAAEFIAEALELDPALRPSASELLRHSWLAVPEDE